MPVAVNCRLVPFAILGLVGVTAIDVSVAAVTVRVVVPLTAPRVAVIVVEPSATAVALPLSAALEMVAVAVDDEVQVTAAVKGWVLLSV